MATKSLPTKPDPDAAFEPARGKGPSKGERAPSPKPIRGSMVLKPAAKATAKDAGGRGTQEPQEPVRRRGGPAEHYVRMRVRVDDDGLSIVGSHLVESPLAQTTAFQGAFAYEVTDGDRLLHAGSIPDLGVVRSFAKPDGTPEQLRHHTYELSTYEFDARVPAAALTRAALPQINVVLYRVKERAPARALPAQALSNAPLDVQRARELREVGRIVGLPSSVLRSVLSTKARRAKTTGKAAKKSARRRKSSNR